MASKEGIILGKPPVIQPINTVGCGDAMTAAFAIAAEKGMNPAESMKYAIAISAASAMHPQTGGIHVADFREIFHIVDIITI